PAPVDVEIEAEILDAHGRALDVPSRPALAPGAIPAPAIRRRPLPQCEIQGVALALARLDAGADLELVEVAPRELAVAFEAADREVDVLRARGEGDDIRGAIGNEALDELDDFADVLAHLGLDRGVLAAERAHVLLVDGRHAGGQGERLFAELLGAVED